MPDLAVDTNEPVVSAQPFHYAAPSGDIPPTATAASGSADSRVKSAASEPSSSHQLMEKAYERGVLEGKAAAREEFEKDIADVRSQIAGTIHAFSKDRTDYFGRIEVEVVRLSLSIARKILHRESQMDPTVLAGVVHVALQKIDGDTRVRLRTHPEKVRFWNDYCKQVTDVYPTVEVVGDSSLSPDHCKLETDFGDTDVNLEMQLKEIENGFFDLLEQRPKGSD